MRCGRLRGRRHAGEQRQHRARLHTRWRLISFYPRDLRVHAVDGERALRGQLWLQTGAATSVFKMRYRLGTQEWRASAPEETGRSLPTASSGGRTTYSFEIPLDEEFRGVVQFEVTQNDRFESNRTYSYRVQ